MANWRTRNDLSLQEELELIKYGLHPTYSHLTDQELQEVLNGRLDCKGNKCKIIKNEKLKGKNPIKTKKNVKAKKTAKEAEKPSRTKR